MAAAAIHLALPNRVRKRFHCLCALLLVAIETDLRLGRRYQDRVCCRMTAVTVRTRDLLHVMRTAVPGEAEVILVAGCAILVLFQDRHDAVGRKRFDRRTLFAAPDPTRVRIAWSMACLALQLLMPERRARIRSHGMFAAKYSQCRLVVMAGKTSVCALAAISGLDIV
jgi:hypothetical protein